MDKGHSSAPTAIPCCTLVPSWGWEGGARRALGAGRAGERGERTHMPTTCPLTRLGLQVSKVLKRGDTPGGEAANPRPLLFLVPGRHYKRVHLLPKYRTREAQHTPGWTGSISYPKGPVSASALPGEGGRATL